MRSTSTRSFGRMKPPAEVAPAGVDGDRHRAHAGRQDGRHEAAAIGLDQLLAPDRLAGQEGVAGHRARRLLDRARCVARLMKPGGTASAGQGCQRRSPARNVWPSGRSPAATSTSLMATVVAGGTGAGAGGGAPRPIMRAAAPPERIAIPRTARRAGFMTAESERDEPVDVRIPPAKGQIMVNQMYPFRAVVAETALGGSRASRAIQIGDCG